MLRKTIAAAAAFAATLFFSLGCPRQEAAPDSKAEPAATAAKPDEPKIAMHSAAGPAEAVPAKQPANDLRTAESPTPEAAASDPLTSGPTAAKIPNVPAPATPINPSPAPPANSPVPSPKPAPAVAEAPSASVGPSAGAQAGDPPFKDWPKPTAVIVCTGMQMGYIEPCGCSGLENQKGGLSRRANFLKKLAADGWPVEAVDVGGQIERFGKQAELKFLATADALKTMHYAAIGFGPDDLKLPAESLTLGVTDLKQSQSPFVSANVGLFGFDQGLTPRFRVDTVGGIKIGVTSILGDAEQKSINNSDVAFKPAQRALAEVVPEMKKAGAERMLLLAQASKEETLAIAKKFPEFDFIVVSYGAPVPPPQPATVPGSKTRLIEVSQKAEYVNVIGLFDGAADGAVDHATNPVRFERVALDAHWGESRDMKRIMADYQEQLKTLGLAGLGVTAAKHPSGLDIRRLGNVRPMPHEGAWPSGRKRRTPRPSTRWRSSIRRAISIRNA